MTPTNNVSHFFDEPQQENKPSPAPGPDATQPEGKADRFFWSAAFGTLLGLALCFAYLIWCMSQVRFDLKFLSSDPKDHPPPLKTGKD